MIVNAAIVFLTCGQQLREAYMRHTVSHFLKTFSKTIAFLWQHGEVLELVPNLSKAVPEHQKTASSQLHYQRWLDLREVLFCLAKAHFTASIFCILYTH